MTPQRRRVKKTINVAPERSIPELDEELESLIHRTTIESGELIS